MRRIEFLLRIMMLLMLFLVARHVSAAQLSGIEIISGLWRGEPTEYLAGQFVVGLAEGKSAASLYRFLSDSKCLVVEPADRFGVLVGEVGESSQLFEFIEKLDKSGLVRFVEPVIVNRLFLTPNDSDFARLWGLNNTGQNGGVADADMDAPEGWNYGVGDTSIIVGVLDTGIPIVNGRLSHPDLDDSTRYLLGPNYEIPGNLPIDDNGHGTHVAGTIAAETNNGIGVAGVNWQCRLLIMKVFSAGGYGSSLWVRSAIIYGADHGCKILSFSGGGGASEAQEEAIVYANSKGTILCAAAGNNYHSSVSYPAAYSLTHPNVICVSSSDRSDNSSVFSSVGPQVTVAAPGSDIYSTFPNYTVYLNQQGYTQNYATLSGTSMATPHVSGLCALIFGLSPLLAPDSLRRIVMNTSDDRGAPGFDNEFGHGRINAERALDGLKNINISHIPLTDTKDSVNAYEIFCAISSIAPLNPDQLFLFWKTTGWWSSVPLIPARDVSFFEASIPAQRPGTVVSYYLQARNYLNQSAQTAVSSFKIIDYQFLSSPSDMDSIGASGDTIWQTFKVTNDGNYSDSYSLTTTISSWPTTIWNSAGTSQITSVGPVTAGQSESAKLRIIIPVAAAFGATDSTRLTIRSQHNAALVNTIRCQTLTEGPAAVIPHYDSFDSPLLSANKWITNSYAVVDTLAINPPTGGLSLHLDGDPYGGDTLMSQVIDASSFTALNLYYAVEQGGKLNEPEADEDLELQYYSSADKWTPLKQHLGAEPASGSFIYVSIPLPVNAMHRRLRIRFISTGQTDDRDNWFIDDFGIRPSSQISQSVIGSLSPTLSSPQQATASWRIQNTGAAPLTYNLEIIPDERPTKSQTSAIAATPPEARGPDPIIVKGGEEPPAGPFRNIYNGGPDSGGYYWSSSNDSPGPGYSWIDISASGTMVTGLLDDNVVGPLPIGFAFPFYDSLHTEFYISSNGLVGFADGEGLDSPIRHSIPNLLPPDNFIALLWDDLVFNDPLNPSSRVFYQSDGSRLIIQYSNVAEYGGSAGDVFSGEVILHSDGTITLQYQSFASGFDRVHCAVGIEGSGGLTGLQVVFSAYFIEPQMAVRFSKRQVEWLAVEPMSGFLLEGATSNVALTFSSQDVSPGYYSAQVKLRCSDPDLVDSLIIKNVSLNVTPPFTIGDSNGDGLVNIGDILTIISCVFGPGEVPQPMARADVDCSGRLTISDAVYLIMYIFAGGPAPCVARQGGSL